MPAPRTYNVTSDADVVDLFPGDGACRTWSGACTLRAAVMEGNASGGGTIVLPAGRFTLRIAPDLLETSTQVAPVLGQDRRGDYDITTTVTIRGAGQTRTPLDGAGIHRVLQVHLGANLSLADLTITGGRVQGTFGDQFLSYSGGGAIWSSATLSLTRVTVTGNQAGYGGGIFNDPASNATFTDSTISANRAGEAGGVRCDASCSFTRTTVEGNVVTDPGDPTRPGSLAGTGGGVDIRGVLPVSFTSSRIVGNSAVNGGGINAGPGYVDTFPQPPVPNGTQVLLRDTTVTGNTASGQGGDCRGQFAQFVDLGGNTDSDGTCNVE